METEETVEQLKNLTLARTDAVTPDMLPRLVYLLSPATLPREGIPMIDLTEHVLGRRAEKTEGTAV